MSLCPLSKVSETCLRARVWVGSRSLSGGAIELGPDDLAVCGRLDAPCVRDIIDDTEATSGDIRVMRRNRDHRRVIVHFETEWYVGLRVPRVHLATERRVQHDVRHQLARSKVHSIGDCVLRISEQRCERSTSAPGR